MQVTDPVCGMKLESGNAVATETVAGQALYFCSEDCHAKYRANPDRYAKAAREAGAERAAKRSC